MQLLRAIFIFTILAACASTTKSRQQNLELIKPGLTQAEVIDRIGEPEEKVLNGPTETWQYNIYSADSSHEYPYRAEFKYGLLLSFNPDGNAKGRDRKSGPRHRASRMISVEGSNNGPTMLKGSTPTP